MQPHQQRVVSERDELQDKITKLGSFFSSPTYRSLNADEQSRLTRQHGIMKEYRAVLNDRIGAF